MAATSITASVTPSTSGHHRSRATFSGSAATTLVPAPPVPQPSGNTNPQALSGELTNMQPPQIPASSQQQQQPQQQQQQSQPSSQQSFSMSQPSSQTVAAPSSYRQYTDMPQKPQSDPDMGIYTVRAQTITSSRMSLMYFV
jgi:hypothetical protein